MRLPSSTSGSRGKRDRSDGSATGRRFALRNGPTHNLAATRAQRSAAAVARVRALTAERDRAARAVMLRAGVFKL